MYDFNQSERATRAVIRLGNLSRNIQKIRDIIGQGRKICLAVKADGYGHGAVAVSRAALKSGVSCLAVSNTDEVRELREAGIHAPVLLLGYPLYDDIPEIIATRAEPMVGDEELLQRLNNSVLKAGTPPLTIHIKVDTGMGRIGCAPENAPGLARLADTSPGLVLGGVCTHFPVSDSTDPDDADFTRNQINTMLKIKNEIITMGIDPGLLHSANSGGILQHSVSHMDMVRLGISAYGYLPDPSINYHDSLYPVMELKSRISFLKTVQPGQSVSYGRVWTAEKETCIATVPVGYGDGYLRLLSGKASVLIRGRRYPVAGRICMDQLMVDLGSDSGIGLNEEVTLFGPDPAGPSAAELADQIGTIPYEITCGVSKRVPRKYLDD